MFTSGPSPSYRWFRLPRLLDALGGVGLSWIAALPFGVVWRRSVDNVGATGHYLSLDALKEADRRGAGFLGDAYSTGEYLADMPVMLGRELQASQFVIDD